VVIGLRRIEHASVAARRIDHKSDVLERGANSGVDHVENVLGVADTDVFSVSCGGCRATCAWSAC
jgi:hypothetical protein